MNQLIDVKTGNEIGRFNIVEDEIIIELNNFHAYSGAIKFLVNDLKERLDHKVSVSDEENKLKLAGIDGLFIQALKQELFTSLNLLVK